MTYGKLTKEQFDEMQFNAGLLVRTFDPASPSIEDEDIICATTGGFELSITPEFVDLGADVYMMPPSTAEMLLISDWTVECAFTSISSSARVFRLALGAADTDGAITPRDDVQAEDFTDLWWIGDRVDGGIVAVKLCNALSDDGFDYTTEQNAVGGLDVHLLAHTSFDMDGAIPVEIYSIEARPYFQIAYHRYLEVGNIENDDTFRIDEETGELYIEQTGEWTYNLVDHRVMEVSK